jgi:hypothetical protein
MKTIRVIEYQDHDDRDDCECYQNIHNVSRAYSFSAFPT